MNEHNTASGAADDSLLLCASDLQHSAIYDNHVEMQACIRAVANRIAALASAAASAQPGQEGEREAFIRWYMEYLHTDEMLAAYVWDNEHIVPQTWRAARAAPQPATADALDAALIQKLVDALSVAILQNNCSMVMTGEELRQARSAIALGRARLDGKSHESST